MAKITIAQLQTSDSYINELTATEMDATKGGLLDRALNKLTAQVGIVNVDDTLNHSLNNNLNQNSLLNGNDVDVDL
jgi:hypothetical protein